MPTFSINPLALPIVLALPITVIAGASTNQDVERGIAGIGAPITIELDDRAVPKVIARDSDDAHAGLGFLHAENRFFQMDVLRRKAAGELSALAGPLLLNMDREPAIARRRDLAIEIFRGLREDQRATVEAYTRGVNASMAAWTWPVADFWALRLFSSTESRKCERNV